MRQMLTIVTPVPVCMVTVWTAWEDLPVTVTQGTRGTGKQWELPVNQISFYETKFNVLQPFWILPLFTCSSISITRLGGIDLSNDIHVGNIEDE